MKLRKTAAVFSIIAGLGMIGLWLTLIQTGQDLRLNDEFRTIPFSIFIAIGSDFLTAFVLLVAAAGLLFKKGWGPKAFLFGSGFLFYSVINALGLYWLRGELPFIVMLAVILVLALVLTVFAFRAKEVNDVKMVWGGGTGGRMTLNESRGRRARE
jgi:hypothetical protein